MTTNKGRGRSRKERPIRHLTDGMKKAVVYLVCVSLIGTSMLSSSVFADESDTSISEPGDVIVYLDNDGSVESGSNAVRSGGSGGGSGKAGVSSSVITEDEVESAANAIKTSETVMYEGYSDGITVIVEAPEGALPDGAELVVERYAADSDEFADAAEAIGHGSDDENMAAIDIHFELDGEEVEPDKEVTVSIDVSDILPEEADPASIVVTHLEETRSEESEEDEDSEESDIAELSLTETAKKVKPVVVANKNKGEIDKENAVAKFAVKNFSTFTIEWNDESGDTIVVHVYNINGTSIDEELNEYTHGFDGGSNTINISDLVGDLHSSELYTNEYTFQYATVAYQVAQQPSGYSMTVIGGENDSVESIAKSGTTYTITHETGSNGVTDPDDIVIRLYYSVPTVTINTENAHENTVNFTTSYAYFQHITDGGAGISYTWQLSNDSEGTIVPSDGGTAIYTWSETATVGDTETVIVTMTVTYTDEEGEEKTETASATYTLTYGDSAVTITVYQTDGTTPQANARVALVNTGTGETVATGKTDANGNVTLYASDGTYTVGVTYVEQTSTIGGGSTSRWTAETTVIVTENGGTASVILGDAITSGPGGDTNGTNGGGSGPYYYEHVDVKVAVAETSTSDVTFSDLDEVYVYDKYGNLLYTSDDLNANPGTTDYNVLFDINDNEDQHSIVVSSEDTIVIVYEVYDVTNNEYKTFTATYTGNGSYNTDDYYLYNAVNAYQLWNQLYGVETGTTYDSQGAFETAWTSGQIRTGYNEAGIPIGEVSYSLVADYLCDTRTTSGQAGLDFVIEVFDSVFNEYDIQIAKTYTQVPESFNNANLPTFSFTLKEINAVTATDDDPEAIWDTNGDNLVETHSGTTSGWTGGNGTWSSLIRLENILEYEAEDGTNFYYYVLSEDDPQNAIAETQYVGIMITVTYSSSTGQAKITASYCELEKDEEAEGVYNKIGGWTEMYEQEGTDENGDSYSYFEVPFTNTYVINISGSKVWVNDNISDRPESITIDLYADYTGEEGEQPVRKVTIYPNANGDWPTWEFDNLPVYKEVTDNDTGETTLEEIVYTVIEGVIAGGKYIPSYEYTTDGSGNINVTITNAIPELQKYVSDPSFRESTDDNLSEDEADNHDTLKYKLEADHIGGAHGLVLHDFLDDQLDIETLAIQSVILYADENDTGTTLVENEDYTLTTGKCTVEGCNMDGCSFEIHIEDEDIENLSSDAYVIVIFDIDLVEGVEDFNEEIYVDEIDNDLSLSFTAFSVTAWAVPVEVETFSYGFDLYKYDSETEEPLAGVEFVLSKSGDNGTVYAQFEVTNNTYLLSEWVDSKDVATPIVTGSDGKAVVEGLHDGTFFIEETRALEGYEQKEGNITLTITVDPDDPFSPTIEVSGANADGLEVQIGNIPYITVSGSKTWVNDNISGRPESITIYLLADGSVVDSKEVTESEGWEWEFTELEKYNSDENEIVYTISEVVPDNYTASYSDDHLSVTNTYTPDTEILPDTVDISGSKTWEGDEDHERPESITIYLLADGSIADSKNVSTADEWKWTFSDLTKFNSDGNEIVYTISEVVPDNYTASYSDDHLNVTNTYNGNDSDDNDGDDDGGSTTGGTTRSTTGGGGGGVRPGTNSGPGVETAETEGDPSESETSSSVSSINTDDIGGLPQTGESNTAAMLMGLCAVFVVLLGGLFYIRRKTPREDE